VQIGGFEKLSLKDYPGKISCIVYTIGCNFLCKYCYNTALLNESFFEESGRKRISEKEIIDYIKLNDDMIEGVVITGGEPTIQPDILAFCQTIKKLGKSIKLDTNGSRPDVIKSLIDAKLVDYIAMDVKAPLDKYKQITAYEGPKNITSSINVIKKSGIPHEFRLTMYPELDPADISSIIDLISGDKLYIQNFQPENALFEGARKLIPLKDDEILANFKDKNIILKT
jgi:pyruvate formate lyase activating enzyme